MRKPLIPTCRQAAEILPAGAMRATLDRFAREYFESRRGHVAEAGIESLQLVMQMHHRAFVRQAASDEAEQPRGVREFLRASTHLDRLLRWIDRLWEDAYRFARERAHRELSMQLPERVWESDVADANFEAADESGTVPADAPQAVAPPEQAAVQPMPALPPAVASTVTEPQADRPRVLPHRKLKIRKGKLVA